MFDNSKKYANIERFINKVRQGNQNLIFDCFHYFCGNTIGDCTFALLRVLLVPLTSFGVVGVIMNVSKFSDFKQSEKVIPNRCEKFIKLFSHAFRVC